MSREPSLDLRARLAAFLLPTLPAGVAMAAYAHGHGSLSGRALGAVVLLAIIAGAVAAVKLLAKGGIAERSELAPVARLFQGYRS